MVGTVAYFTEDTLREQGHGVWGPRVQRTKDRTVLRRGRATGRGLRSFRGEKVTTQWRPI